VLIDARLEILHTIPALSVKRTVGSAARRFKMQIIWSPISFWKQALEPSLHILSQAASG
jgi:hypothetical protein